VYSRIDEHIDKGLERVRREVVDVEAKTARAALDARSPAEKVADDARFKADWIKRLGYDPKGDWLACMDFSSKPPDPAVERAQTAWRHEHRVEIVLWDVLYWPTVVIGTTVSVIAGVLPAVAHYLSFPLKIALGLGFGIARGAWIISRAMFR
jgi:hypothetical protein